MKKYLLLFSLFLFGVMFNANAQSGYEDVVYLKNGSIIRGMIIEQIPNESIKLETRDGNIFVYKMDEIQKLTKEASNYRNSGARATKFRQSQFNKPQGYMGIVEIGGGLGLGQYAAERVSVSMINGYRILPQFAVGLGVGAEMFFYRWYDYNNGDEYSGPELSLPVFLHLRSDFIAGKVSPYVAVNAGYNISLSGGFIGGIVLEPSAGVGFNVGQKNRLMVGVGYALNRVKYYYGSSYYGYYEETGMAGALKLKIGFSF